MNKFHILGAFLMLAAWSSNITSPTVTSAHRFQIGAAAQANVRWTPNPRRGSATSTIPGGSRTASSACALDADRPDPAITLLVPQENQGLTTLAQPTLSWYIESDNLVDMEFNIFHPDQADPIYTKALQSGSGLVEVTLPESAALEVGTAYHWSVFVSCNGGEFAIHTRSFVERVDDSDVSLSADSDAMVEQAMQYAEQGIWYDALSTLVSSYREDGQLSTLLEIRNLLEQAETDVPLELSLAIES